MVLHFVVALLGPIVSIVSRTMSKGLPTCCSLMGRTCFHANLKVGSVGSDQFD